MLSLKSIFFSLLSVVVLTLPNSSVRVVSATLDKIKIHGSYYVDQSNRIKLFHGINAVRKGEPWTPANPKTNMADPVQLNNLRAWGFNCVRLGVMWSGLFPEKGVVNQTYAQILLDIVDQLALRGIYVIINMHQDMLSSKFESYDGVPLWLMNSLPSTVPYPFPFISAPVGKAAYATYACSDAFQCLYDNVNGFEDAYHLYWTTVAGLFKNRTSVLAYDLINEPWAGNIYKDPSLLAPGVAELKNLMGFYDRVYAKIRSVDPVTIIMYQPLTWGLGLVNTFFSLHFSFKVIYCRSRSNI
jgi:endoglycosylceramidase